MNSLGVSPYVNWIYSDLADGLIIFQVIIIIHFLKTNGEEDVKHDVHDRHQVDSVSKDGNGFEWHHPITICYQKLVVFYNYGVSDDQSDG